MINIPINAPLFLGMPKVPGMPKAPVPPNHQAKPAELGKAILNAQKLVDPKDLFNKALEEENDKYTDPSVFTPETIENNLSAFKNKLLALPCIKENPVLYYETRLKNFRHILNTLRKANIETNRFNVIAGII